MEKTKMPYEEWPEKLKLLTAFRLKAITIKEPGFITGISIVNILVGLLLFIPILYFLEGRPDTKEAHSIDFWSTYIATLNVVIGSFNLFFTKNAVAWIRDNSSWEERDKHKSASKYKLQYALIMLGVFVLPWLIACLICC